MTGLQFGYLATRSGRNHSLLFNITWQKQLETASNYMNSLLISQIYSYLKPLDYPQVPTLKN